MILGEKTPTKEVLQPNPNAAPFDAEWSYRFVIGKLNFLAQNTRPDISMTEHVRKICQQSEQDSPRRRQVSLPLPSLHTNARFDSEADWRQPSQRLCRQRFCWSMVSRNLSAPRFRRLSNWLRHRVLRLPYSLGKQTSIGNRSFYSLVSTRACTSRSFTKITLVALNLSTSLTNFVLERNTLVSNGTNFDTLLRMEVSWSKRSTPVFNWQIRGLNRCPNQLSKHFASF
jgi:hypothetical protein